jgi:hypothetical protein
MARVRGSGGGRTPRTFLPQRPCYSMALAQSEYLCIRDGTEQALRADREVILALVPMVRLRSPQLSWNYTIDGYSGR